MCEKWKVYEYEPVNANNTKIHSSKESDWFWILLDFWITFFESETATHFFVVVV